METTLDPRFPIGRCTPIPELEPADREARILEIAATPTALRDAVAGLGQERLDTPYRDDGWSVRQLVHHMADSHMQAFSRFKLALTEDEPTIKPYREAAWADLPDSRLDPEISLVLLEALHARWVALLRGMTPDQFHRTLLHPEHGRRSTLDASLQIYAWHGRHHVAHVTALRERRGW